MVRLPSTNSRICSNVSRSMFCMVMFIHPQHGTFFRLSRSGSSRIGNNLPLRARPALETNRRFRLIPHWIILLVAFCRLIGYTGKRHPPERSVWKMLHSEPSQHWFEHYPDRDVLFMGVPHTGSKLV